MSISLKTTQNKQKEILLISSKDEAIDWERSLNFPETFTDDEGNEYTGLKAKEKYFQENPTELEKIVFKNDEKPTCFVFKNPATFEVAADIKDIFISASGIVQKRDPRLGKMNKLLWNKVFVGYFDGFPSDYKNDSGVSTMLQKPFSNGNINDSFIEACHDADILEEIGGYIQKISEKKMKR